MNIQDIPIMQGLWAACESVSICAGVVLECVRLLHFNASWKIRTRVVALALTTLHDITP